MEDLCCGHNKAVRLLAELDTKGVGLIERKKQGQGKPTMIYVKQFVETVSNAPKGKSAPSRLPKMGSQEDSKEEVQTSQNETSRLPENGSAEFPKRETNYTDTSNCFMYLENVEYPVIYKVDLAVISRSGNGRE